MDKIAMALPPVLTASDASAQTATTHLTHLSETASRRQTVVKCVTWLPGV